MANVHLKAIRKSFGKVDVLHGVSIDIASGELVGLLGPSGCGKTTLLRILAGLDSVTSGTVEIDGRDVTALPPERRDLAMMFQSYALLPHLSVAENVRFPLRMRRIGGRDEQAVKVAAALEIVQLGHVADRRPRQLSGGQQQRVALARAIVSDPKVLLLDEPLSNLDARLREDMQVELIEIHRRLGLTTLFVTHDQEEALSLSDKVVLLNAGRVEQEGKPAEIYASPRTSFASSFLGSANLVPAVIRGQLATLGEELSIPLPGTSVEGPATLSIRQEDIDLKPAGEAGLQAVVRTRVFLGGRTRYVLSAGNLEIRALAPANVAYASGERVSLAIDTNRVTILPA